MIGGNRLVLIRVGLITSCSCPYFFVLVLKKKFCLLVNRPMKLMVPRSIPESATGKVRQCIAVTGSKMAQRYKLVIGSKEEILCSSELKNLMNQSLLESTTGNIEL